MLAFLDKVKALLSCALVGYLHRPLEPILNNASAVGWVIVRFCVPLYSSTKTTLRLLCYCIALLFPV